MENFRTINGIVTDISADLMWLPPKVEDDRERRYVDAEFEVSKLRADSYMGYKNWRLPTKEELENVMNLARTREWVNKGKPSISEWFKDRGIYLKPGWYWTCTRWGQGNECLWCVSFNDGEVDVQHEQEKHFLWPVRTIE